MTEGGYWFEVDAVSRVLRIHLVRPPTSTELLKSLVLYRKQSDTKTTDFFIIPTPSNTPGSPFKVSFLVEDLSNTQHKTVEEG